MPTSAAVMLGLYKAGESLTFFDLSVGLVGWVLCDYKAARGMLPCQNKGRVSMWVDL